MKVIDNSPIDSPCIGMVIEEKYSVGQFEDNHLYLIAEEDSLLAQKAAETIEDFNARMLKEEHYYEYVLEVIPSVELRNHPKIQERVDQYGDNMIIQFSVPEIDRKRFLVARTNEEDFTINAMLMIYETDRNIKYFIKEVLKSFVIENPDEFKNLAKEVALSKRFLAQYFANLSEELLHPSFEMAASLSSIKERLDIKGLITHAQRMKSYMHLLDNLKNYHKTKDPKIDAELDIVFNSIDPATWKMFFLKQSPKLQEKMFNYVNPQHQAEVSTMDIEVRKMSSIDKNRKNDGYYRLFLKREYESLMVHFSRKNGFILYLIYLLDRKKNGNKVDTLNISQYKELFGKLYKVVYGINGESIFIDMMKNFNANNEVQQKGLYTVLKSIRDDIGSTCERMQEPAEPFLLNDIASHLAVLPEHIILPAELMTIS